MHTWKETLDTKAACENPIEFMKTFYVEFSIDMYLYSSRKKCIYFRIPKAASRSIKKAIQQYSFKQFKKCNVDDLEPLYKFAFVRNPFDRLVSVYKQAQKMFKGKEFDVNDLSFEDFVNQEVWESDYWLSLHCLPQYHYLTFNDQLITDNVFKYENLNKSWDIVCKKIDIYPKKLKVVNASKRKPYQEYYTPKLQKKVKEIYIDDLKRFHYKYET